MRHQSEEAGTATLLIPANGDPDEEISVGVFFVEPPLPDLEATGTPLRHLARLPLPSGAAVDLLWTTQPREVGQVEDARHLFYNGASRELPVVLSKSEQFAYVAGHRRRGRWRGVRGAIEIAVALDRAVRLVSLKAGSLREDAYEADGDPDETPVVHVLGRRYSRLRPDFREYVEEDGRPIYLQDDLKEVTVLASAPLEDRDEAAVAAEVARAVGRQARALIARRGARPLMSEQTVTLPSGTVVGFCVLAQPTTMIKASLAVLRTPQIYVQRLLQRQAAGDRQ